MDVQQTKRQETVDFYNVFKTVVKPLPERSQDIIAKRFGVSEKKPYTLQAIGDEYNITRERVRQIVQSGLRNVHDVDEYEDLEAARDLIVNLVHQYHGIVSEDAILNQLGGDHHAARGSVRFFVEGFPEIEFVNIKKFFTEFGIKVSKNSIVQLGKIKDLEFAPNATFYNLKNDYGIVVYD